MKRDRTTRAPGTGSGLRDRMLRLGLLTLFLVPIAACGGSSRGEPDFKPTRGVVLISIDTLRADHLSSYGYTRATTPFLDSLAAKGVLFEHVFAQMPNTLTSHMTALTGLYPAEHGVYPPDGVLSPEIPILAEVFQRQGYQTGGVTEAGYMKGSYGFSRGFDSFSDDWRPWKESGHRIKRRRVEDTLAQGLDFLRSVPKDRRFFLFLHTYVVHAPYDPPPPYDAMFWTQPRPDVFAPTGPNMGRFNQLGGELPPHALEYFRALYDGEIRYADDQLREFFSKLDAMGLGRDLTVIVMSDHGEEFLEHGVLEHWQLYRETLHVPLIVVHPQLNEGLRVAEPVELVDLTPTICSLAGIPCPRDLSGRSLARELRGKGRPTPSVYAYSEMHKGAERTLIWDEGDRRYQLVLTGVGEHAWLGKSFAFDLPANTHQFDITSFKVPRDAQVTVDGKAVKTLHLTPQWQTVTLSPEAQGRRRRVRIQTDGCLEVNSNEDRARCLAFSVRNPQPQRIELFDMKADPLEKNDISFGHPDIVRRILKKLEDYKAGPRAKAGRLEVTGEHRKRLEALGYVN